MGRPLKIAKAQAVLTITATATTGSVVTIAGGNLTTTPTVGVASGMSFQVTTTVGGLTAGVTYYVNAILSNTTFSASATQLSVQPQVMASLTGTSGQTGKVISFNVVDAYFNNPESGAGFPATNTATYGVVGGNTGIVGKQVLTRVAIGIAGNGTLYTSSANANVFGVGTDFTSQLSAGSALQVAVANANGSTDYVNLGFVSGAVAGYANIELSNATATGNFLTSVGNAQTLFASQPVVLSANIGGLAAGTTYFVRTIANAAAFTVASYVGGGNISLTDEDAESYAVQDRVVLTGSASTTASNAAFIYADDEAGYIVRQKGKTKYLVKGGTTGLTAQCYTANVANAALTPNTMNLLGTYANSATKYLTSVNDYNSEVFPAQVAAGSLSANTVYTIYSAGTTDWTLVGAMASMTGITFTATTTGSGTGTAVLSTVNPDIIATFNTAITTVAPASFVVNTTYVIVSLGNTDWAAVGAAYAAVGTMFTATAAGSGTGTASIAGVVGPIVTITSA